VKGDVAADPYVGSALGSSLAASPEPRLRLHNPVDEPISTGAASDSYSGI
jgi:hypothetical protein